VKYLVLQCNPAISQVYNQSINNQGVCAYEVDGAPLVSPITTLTRTTEDIPSRGINKTEAVIVEECQKDCSITVPGAEISNVKWEPELISFNTNGETPSMVLVRSAYFSPRWNVYINGEPGKITEVWPKYMLIEAPKGNAKIELKYESNLTHNLAWLITILAILASLYLLTRKGQP